MKAYQIHEYGGVWEDKFDYLVKTYLSREKAEKEKLKLEQEEKENQEQWEKCRKCPIWNKINIEKEEMLSYCKKYEPFDPTKHDLNEYDEDDDCVNYCYGNDMSFYRIEEIEVIE